MRKIIFCGCGPTVGMDYAVAQAFDDDVTDAVLDQEAWYMTVQNAESYGYYVGESDENDDEEEQDSYIDGSQLDGWWEVYDPEQHDGHRSGGGSFEQDF